MHGISVAIQKANQIDISSVIHTQMLNKSGFHVNIVVILDTM